MSALKREEIEIRPSVIKEGELFKNILFQPGVLEYFPMCNLPEVLDAIRIWEIFCKQGASLTAIVEKEPCGLAFLNIQYYQKFAHQCLITIVVDEKFRGKGIGKALLEALFVLAKETFHLEILYLEVHHTNRAIELYRRMGFRECGVHKNFLKEDGRYIHKIFMEKVL